MEVEPVKKKIQFGNIARQLHHVENEAFSMQLWTDFMCIDAEVDESDWKELLDKIEAQRRINLDSRLDSVKKKMDETESNWGAVEDEVQDLKRKTSPKDVVFNI